jgi:hypothetical protein
MALSGLLRRVVGVAVGLGLGLGLGCGSSPAPTSTAPPSTTINPNATNVYVVQQPATGTGAILAFTATGNGSVSPSSTLTMPSGFTANAVATDAAGQIYVAGVGASGPSVLVFAAGASGSATPARTILGIAGSTTNFSTPVALALDSGGLVYVLGQGTVSSIAVYSASASGAATPIRVIAGALTQVSDAEDLTVDAGGNIYATAGSAILVFSGASLGNVAPVRTITAASGVALNGLQGIAADGNGDVFVVNYPPSGPPATIVEFAAGAGGNATPVKTIAGPATGMTNVGGLTLDASANIYVAGATSTTAPYGLTVSKFLSTVSGNVSPNNILSSTSWTTPAYGQVAAF